MNAALATSAPRPEAARVLEVQDISKAYGPNPVLSSVSLSVCAGEFSVLLGPNGAGKTTLFNLITALFYPDSGWVKIHGFETARQPVSALGRVGVVFQQPTLDLSLTGRQNLLFHADLHGIPYALAYPRMMEEAERLSIAPRLNEKAAHLNGGHRRRLELIRALLHRPSVLLLDEPTAGLDMDTRTLLVRHIRSLCERENTAVLWATHLLEEVAGADNITVLHQGRTVFTGTEPAMLKHTEQSNLAAAFTHLTPKKKNS
ncbi:MAG: ATP-binding cassette domain-containing protein [Deltaproteobacteria bacterium]|nr:ATP-binding cassette domain-containing protein [Deltaproteobacteria bacterium]